MRYFLAFLLSLTLNAATITVCTSGCTTTSLQTALNTLAMCGDTIVIKSTEPQTGNFTFTYRGCTAMTPITVTSDRAAMWLPSANQRVTPSQVGNMAKLVTNNSASALQAVLDGSNRPPAHWVFVGLAFSTTSFTFNLLGLNTNAVNSSQVTDDITVDRCFFTQQVVYAGEALQNVIYGDATNLTVKNSFLGDGFMNGVESHGIFMLTNPGPVTVTNNYITTSSSPVFVGGFTPTYQTYLANGMTVNYNYFYRPWKWNPDPMQPFAADYTAAQTGGGYSVCQKNLGELKWGVGVTWQYNVGENSFEPAQCGSQFNGFTDTLRTGNESNAVGTPFYNPNIGTFAMSDTTHITWTGTYRIGNTSTGAFSSNTQDLGVCIDFASTTGRECHGVTSFSGASLVAATPFSAAPAGALNGEIVYMASAQLKNLSVQHNVWKNVDLVASGIGVASSNGIGDNGFGKNENISQNLWFANTSYIGPNSTGFRLEGADFDYSYGPSGWAFDHNTIYYPTGMHLTAGAFVYVLAVQGATIQPKFDTTALTNNLFGTSSTGGNGPFSGDAVGTVVDTANRYFTNSNIKNNAIPGGINGGTATGGNTVSGNQYQAWADPFGGLGPSGRFEVVSSSPYYNAGTDGSSLGANFSALPLITNLFVTPAPRSATLTFTTNVVNNDVKNTQPCTLEVSTSNNLINDLGTYSVISSLNPTITIGADLSTQSSVTVTGNNVNWPLTGLAIATTYYGRLMCYGDTQFFQFTTSSGTNSISIVGTASIP